MLRDVFGWPLFWLFGTPAIVGIGLTALTAWSWKRDLTEEKPVKQRIESYRNPISSGITVAGLVIPLVCGLGAYLLNNQLAKPQELTSLVSSILLLSVAILLGLYISYSLASIASDNDEFTINPKENWLVPALLVLHFVLLFAGFAEIVGFFTLQLRVPAAKASAPPPAVTAGLPVLRPIIRPGMTRADVVAAWGAPASATKNGETELLTYRSDHTIYRITIQKDLVTSFEERSP